MCKCVCVKYDSVVEVTCISVLISGMKRYQSRGPITYILRLNTHTNVQQHSSVFTSFTFNYTLIHHLTHATEYQWSVLAQCNTWISYKCTNLVLLVYVIWKLYRTGNFPSCHQSESFQYQCHTQSNTSYEKITKSRILFYLWKSTSTFVVWSRHELKKAAY